MSPKFKVTFTLDESDASYFRNLYRRAKAGAKNQSREQIIEDARGIVKDVRASKKTPTFVADAISTLADLVDLIQDEDYAAPARVQNEVLAALAYFSDPEDLIPDHIPGLGFLDDAIMVKFIEEEFRHELWGYRKFCKNRDASEQRPWASSAKERLADRLSADRKKIRAAIAEREAKAALKKKSRSHSGW
ncbi:MAG: YkvA family protein [Myxococcota bacterium]